MNWNDYYNTDLEDSLEKDKVYNKNMQSYELYNMHNEDERYHTLKKEIIIREPYKIKNRDTFKIYMCKQFNKYHLKVNIIYTIKSCSVCGEDYNCNEYCRGGIEYDEYEATHIIYTDILPLVYSIIIDTIKNTFINFTYKNYKNILTEINNTYYVILISLLKKLNTKLNYDTIRYICDLIY
jgi:hypothetical protein